MDNSIMSKNNIDDLYKAIAWAETGSSKYSDPWIRTGDPYSESSAYGPVQMTGGGGSDKAVREKKISIMWNVYHNPKMAEDMGINEKERNYISRFLEQADKFLDPVSDEMGSTYGYEGPGVLRTEEDKALYESTAKKIMKYQLDKFDGNIDEFVKDWRKKKDKYGKVVEDVEYNRKFQEKLAELHGRRQHQMMFPDDAVMEHALADKTRVIK